MKTKYRILLLAAIVACLASCCSYPPPCGGSYGGVVSAGVSMPSYRPMMMPAYRPSYGPAHCDSFGYPRTGGPNYSYGYPASYSRPSYGPSYGYPNYAPNYGYQYRQPPRMPYGGDPLDPNGRYVPSNAYRDGRYYDARAQRNQVHPFR